LNIIDISALPDIIPQYYKDAIVACRSPSASKRPVAQEILEMFPVVQHSEVGQANSAQGNLDEGVNLLGFFV